MTANPLRVAAMDQPTASGDTRALCAEIKWSVDQVLERLTTTDADQLAASEGIAVLLADTRGILASASACLGGIAERVEESKLSGMAHIGDTAFVGRFALNALQRELASAESISEAWGAIRLAGKAHREASRSLRIIHQHCCLMLGCEVHRAFFTRELNVALETRQAYAALRRASRRVEVPNLGDSLRHASTTLAVLRSRACFPQLRVYDRVVTEQLFTRIRTWLVNAKAGDTTVDGARLLQEYFNFVEFALEVNKRPELVEHDVGLITLALTQLGKRPMSAMQRLLTELIGRDEALDQQIHSPTDPATLRGELERVLEHIGGERHSEVVRCLPYGAEPGARD
ncbi:MAG: hypothetical protein R3B07_06830 [Polyangiaceae bacterium]